MFVGFSMSMHSLPEQSLTQRLTWKALGMAGAMLIVRVPLKKSYILKFLNV